MIRPLHINDAQELLDIYNYYVLNTTVTFDIEALTIEIFREKLNQIPRPIAGVDRISVSRAGDASRRASVRVTCIGESS